MSSAARFLQVRLAAAGLRRAGRQVLAGIHWQIRPGQRWIVLGANGSGKTQLLKLVAGIVRPSPSSPASVRWRLAGEWHDVPLEIRQRIVYLGPERQDKYERYDWNLPVADLVGTGLYATDIPLDALTVSDRRRVRAVLRQLGIGSLAPRRFLDLSYGQRRMVLLARALITRPALLILDEVFTGLDPGNHALLAGWLARLRGELPVVIATHEPADIPATATHVLVLRAGRVAYRGTMHGAARGCIAPHTGRAAQVARQRRSSSGTKGRVLVRLKRAHVYLEGSPALRDVSLAVRAGEFWVVHGPNGSGKTTLLRTIYGDHGVAAGGSMQRAGILPGVPLEHFRARTGIAAPYIQASYPRNYTVAEAVLSGRHASIGLQRPFTRTDRHAMQRILRRLGLGAWAQRRLGELSYGQTRLVLFARALVRNPQLLLLDEPFDSIDGAMRAALEQELRRRVARGVAVMVAAHDLVEWLPFATHEIELAGGRVRYVGVPRSGG